MQKFWKQIGKRRWRPSQRDVFMIGIGALVMLAGFRILDYTHNRQVALPAKTATITVPWIPDSVKQWHGTIETMAKRYDIDPNLIAIIMTIESGGDPKADSGQAKGLMQITPATAGDIASRYVKEPFRLYDLNNPETSIEFGTAYLARLRNLYTSTDQGPSWDGTVELVAAAYNGGFGAANSLELGKGLNDSQTVVYSRDAFNMWRERNAATSPTYNRWKERGGQELIDQARSAMATQIGQ